MESGRASGTLREVTAEGLGVPRPHPHCHQRTCGKEVSPRVVYAQGHAEFSRWFVETLKTPISSKNGKSKENLTPLCEVSVSMAPRSGRPPSGRPEWEQPLGLGSGDRLQASGSSWDLLLWVCSPSPGASTWGLWGPLHPSLGRGQVRKGSRGERRMGGPRLQLVSLRCEVSCLSLASRPAVTRQGPGRGPAFRCWDFQVCKVVCR